MVQARWDFRRDLSIGILSSGFGVDSDNVTINEFSYGSNQSNHGI